MRLSRWTMLPLAATLLLAPLSLRADEVRDALAEASRAYAAGDIPAARMALAEAQQLLQQRAGDELAAALPEPLAGWEAEPATAGGNSGLALLGGAGMIQASRTYRHREGRTVELQVSADNPLMAQMMMVFNNPAMAGAMGRLVRVGSHRAIQQQSGELLMVLNNRFLVQISGDGTAQEKLAYAQAINVARLPQ
ncbi:MAG TPA: hypothetical protein VGN96_11150 [Roseococcus sp.]|nr:hypothetical protein [Roseococcus sp.]